MFVCLFLRVLAHKVCNSFSDLFRICHTSVFCVCSAALRRLTRWGLMDCEPRQLPLSMARILEWPYFFSRDFSVLGRIISRLHLLGTGGFFTRSGTWEAPKTSILTVWGIPLRPTVQVTATQWNLNHTAPPEIVYPMCPVSIKSSSSPPERWVLVCAYGFNCFCSFENNEAFLNNPNSYSLVFLLFGTRGS